LVGFDEHWDRLYASPTMDMREMDDCYEVVVSLPGISESDIEVTLEGRILTIVGKVRTSQEGQSSYRQFTSRIQLPGPVDGQQIAKTTLANGMLRISIPKVKEVT
ncbi:MAG: Hsp20/alpha crystallin family protein, partial [Spartobacteria bacterium]|nr:Hsp20/alpha crystallin family protein [Spartobacteria bacterium]